MEGASSNVETLMQKLRELEEQSEPDETQEEKLKKFEKVEKQNVECEYMNSDGCCYLGPISWLCLTLNSALYFHHSPLTCKRQRANFYASCVNVDCLVT